MTSHRLIAKNTLLLFFFLITSAFVGTTLFAQDGKKLFQDNCAQCHNPIKVVTGPALKGATDRIPDAKLLHSWVRNNAAVLATGNKYFNDLRAQYGGTAMNLFPTLTDGEIDAIFKYANSYQPPTTGPETPGASAAESDNSLLYGILTIILAVIMLTLLQINSNLKRLSDEKEGIPSVDAVPFYRNKVYITGLVLVLFVVGGYVLVQGAVGLGRSQGYQPQQPIFYSHKVHAGINQISCLYCHGNAWESRHAAIPSLNVCMNCHAAINEYSGKEKLYREDGTDVDGTAEIQKIYAYTGYDPKTQRYSTPSQPPVEWVKIHNLPDYVYFNHSQHVRAGKVQCQTCHGPIQQMNEVKQFAPLSMGWCINCHRTTKVDFPDSTNAGNKFYSVYTRFHNELKSGEMDSVTVEKIGGTECQKCHY